MDIRFVAGFGPISPDPQPALDFWTTTLGIHLHELAPGYHHTEDLAGTRAFAIWPLAQAAEATFGTSQWPSDRPVPQAWIEFELESPEAVAAGAAELRDRGQEVLAGPKVEPWGQTTARLLSPEGLLVGLSYLPSFHESES
ncbi:VOC family protein [Microbacterium sp. I2]|jgi:catechol 2,3-dioxygenase-like lactoylglutathione lyase family enzyme|uniref:VOC family protein n=1 Tax=Microbacterium sp. I2 TaxID=3391826 RepID=UPI003ED89A2E